MPTDSEPRQAAHSTAVTVESLQLGHKPQAADLDAYDGGYFKKRVLNNTPKVGDNEVYRLKIVEGDFKSHKLKNTEYTIEATKEEFEEAFEKASASDFEENEDKIAARYPAPPAEDE